MNVKEMIEILEKFPPDHNLVVNYRGGIGSSCIPVSNAYLGFDWNRNMVVIHTERPLAPHEWYDELSKRVRNIADKKCEFKNFTTPPIKQIEDLLGVKYEKKEKK